MPCLIEETPRPTKKGGPPRKPSPNWIAVFTIRGKQIWRSTGIPIKPVPGRTVKANGRLKTRTELKADAEKWAEAMDRGMRAEQGGLETVESLRRVLEEAMERLGGSAYKTYTVKSWMASWLKGHDGVVEEATLNRYAQVIEDFLKHLGQRRTDRLNAITTADILGFRRKLLEEGRMPRTADRQVRAMLAAPFTQAFQTRDRCPEPDGNDCTLED
jgi:hypothetical protein